MAPEIVVMKGAQLGMSTTALVRAMWLLTSFPTTAIYTMPTARDVGKFTQGRINPIVRSSQYLLDRIIDVDSVMQKQFVVAPGQLEERRQRGLAFEGPRSTIYFSGASNEKDAVSMDADLLIHDEEDLSDPQIVDQFEHRLDASRFGWRFHLSTPRLPGAGIDAVFGTTDKRRWLVRCPAMHGRVRAGLPGWALAVCQRRARPLRLDRARLAALGAGRATGTLPLPPLRTQPDAARIAPAGAGCPRRPMAGRAHGYAISQLSAPWLDAAKILLSYRKHPWRSDFWNLTMGIPWEEGTNAFTAGRDQVARR